MSNTVVFFGAPWCRPCKTTRPIVESVAASLELHFEYVDVENYDTRANDVTAVPTVRVYDEFDEVIREHRGGAGPGQVRALLGGLA